MTQQINIRPLLATDLDDADRITRVAFGTFNGVPAPPSYMGDAQMVRTRWQANPDWAFGLEVDGRLVGANFAARWGSFGFFGPLAIDPEYWGMGLAGHLIEPALKMFSDWGVSLSALFTFSHSVKHLTLYHKHGFRARSLVLIMEKPVAGDDMAPVDKKEFSHLTKELRNQALEDCRQLAESIYKGLDLSHEIKSVWQQNLGDTLLTYHQGQLCGFAICHTGAGSEAGSGNTYLKFAAAAAGPGAPERFGQLLGACENYARQAGALKLTAGINVGRQRAYEQLLQMGFSLFRSGVAMHQPNQPGFCTPDDFVIDDWR